MKIVILPTDMYQDGQIPKSILDVTTRPSEGRDPRVHVHVRNFSKEETFRRAGVSEKRIAEILKSTTITHRIPAALVTARPCHPGVFLVAYVHSAPHYHNRRDVIRRTWGNTTFFYQRFGLPMELMFAIGRAGEKLSEIQLDVAEEAKHYGDIVLLDYLDSYYNLTYKALASLRWIQSYCAHARFVLKADDDVLVNMFAVMDDLLEWDRQDGRKEIGCVAIGHSPVQRIGKWRVSEASYPGKLWPQYCHGAFFFTRTEVAMALLEVSRYNRFVWVDDAFLTGILRNQLKLDVSNVSDTFRNYKEFENILHTISSELSVVRLKGTWYVYDNHLYLEWHRKVWLKLITNM